MQNASFQAELNQQRQAFQFEKEKNSYNDRRKQSLDEYSVKTADVIASELFVEKCICLRLNNMTVAFTQPHELI
jgi:hypothetical protein